MLQHLSVKKTFYRPLVVNFDMYDLLYLLNNSFSGYGLFVNINLHKISHQMIYNMTIFGKKKNFTPQTYTEIGYFPKFNMAAK